MLDQHGTVRERALAERKRAVALRTRSRELREQADASVDRAVDRLRVKEGPALGAHGDHFALHMPRLPSFVALARHDFRRWLEQNGLEEEDTLDIVLALSEACANAVEHPETASRPAFEVEARRVDRDIEIVVRDFGRWSAAEEPDPVGSSGRGLQMMRELMDQVEVTEDESGTTIVLRRHVPSTTSFAAT